MAESLIGEMIDILRGQNAIYRELLNSSYEKRNVIVKNDVEALRVITGKENLLVGKSQRLDRTLSALIKDIANVLNKKESDITFDFLIDAIKDQPESESIIEIVSELREVLVKLKDMNEQNKALIKNSLEYLEFSINVIRSTVGDEPTYSSPFKNNMTTGKGLFDAKQ